MKNLIKAEFYKQKVNGTLSLYIVIMSIVGIGLSLSNVLDENKYSYFYNYNYLLSNSMLIYMIIATVAAFYHVKDFEEKTIQHSIMSGYTRNNVIFSKMVVINTISTIAFIFYTGLGTLTYVIVSSENTACEYDGSIFLYVVLSLIFKILFIIAFNTLCMLFCYLLRSAAAYFLVMFAIPLSSIGGLYTIDFVSKHSLLKSTLECTIMVQDYKMFIERISNASYNITFESGIKYCIVMVLSIAILYKITCLAISKVELK